MMERVLSLTHHAPALVDILKGIQKSSHSSKCEFEKGLSYMVKEEKAHLSYEAFSQLAAEKDSLVITRIYPPQLKERFTISGKIFWLSAIDKNNTLPPSDLNKLGFIITSFIEDHTDGIILLDGIEYLILQNGFKKVFDFVSVITEKISQSRAILLIPTSPKALTQKEVMLLERKLEPC
jgi:hypothetical protein